MILGLGRSPGEGNGNPLRYSFLENPHEQRSLVGYSSRGLKVSLLIFFRSTFSLLFRLRNFHCFISKVPSVLALSPLVEFYTSLTVFSSSKVSVRSFFKLRFLFGDSPRFRLLQSSSLLKEFRNGCLRRAGRQH